MKELTIAEAKNLLKGNLPEYLKSRGYRLHHGNTCPCCNGGQHKRNVFHYNRKNNTVKCFACGFSGDIFSLVALEYGLGSCRDNFPEIVAKTCELFGYRLKGHGRGNEPIEGRISFRPEFREKEFTFSDKEETDYSGYISWAATCNDYKYLLGRGISREVQERFCIGLDRHWRNPVTVENWKRQGKDISRIPESPRCIIPNSIYSYLARDTRSILSEKCKCYSKQVAGKKRLFNRGCLDRAKTIFVVEGEIDAMSVIEAGFEAVGLCGAANGEMLINELKRERCCKSLVLMLDNDEAGRKGSKALSEELDKIGFPYIDYADYLQNLAHDPNEQLMRNRNEFIYELKLLNRLAERNLTSGLSSLDGRISRAQEHAASYNTPCGKEMMEYGR